MSTASGEESASEVKKLRDQIAELNQEAGGPSRKESGKDGGTSGKFQ